jgi:hypothetical protein
MFCLHELDDHVDRSSGFGDSTERNGENCGYRGNGYNPNFEHADEYPPSQVHVQAPTQKEIDLGMISILLSVVYNLELTVFILFAYILFM